MMIQPTKSVEEALNLFNPLHPLQSKSELESYFVEREHSPLEPLRKYLFAMQQPVKLLFMGHRGSGKSTELAKLASQMQHRFVVVHFAVSESLNINDVQPVDVVLACAVAILKKVVEENFIADPVLQEVEIFLRNEVLVETSIVNKAEATGGATLNLPFKDLLINFSAKFSRESATRKTVRPRLQTQLSELVSKVNEVVTAVKDVHKPLLMLVEGLDKTGLEDARRIFFEEGHLLRELACHTIYTFPISLRYSNDYAQIRQNFSKDFKLPNINIYKRIGDNIPDAAGRACLRSLALKRADASLFDSDSLERAVELSGGLIVDLVRLIQGAFLNALVASESRITVEMVEAVAAEIRSDFRASLRPAHYAALREAQISHVIVNEEAVQEILHNLSLLEYRNSEDWCDPHPIAKPLLDSGPGPVEVWAG